MALLEALVSLVAVRVDMQVEAEREKVEAGEARISMETARSEM